MQMAYPHWFTYPLSDRVTNQVKAYEHEVSITLPPRRYNPDVHPRVLTESPSIVVLGPEERFGSELCIRRVSRDPQPSAEMAAEMLGELVEAWAQLTVDPAPHLD